MSDFIYESQCDEFDDYRPSDQDWADYNEHLYMEYLAEQEFMSGEQSHLIKPNKEPEQWDTKTVGDAL